MLGPGGHPISYMAFIAPALLASSAMNGAIYDSTNNVFFKLRYAKLYDSMLATSLGPLDVAIGEISWALIRGGLYSARLHRHHGDHRAHRVRLGSAAASRRRY